MNFRKSRGISHGPATAHTSGPTARGSCLGNLLLDFQVGAGLSCISECQDRGQRYRDARAFSTADSASPPGGAVCTVDSASTAAEALSASRAEAALPQASAILSLQLPGLSSRAPGAPLRGWELGPLCPGSLPCISLALGTPSRLSIPHPELS